MTCGIDGNNTDQIKMTLDLDEADVVISALSHYEMRTGQMIAHIQGGGGNAATSLTFELAAKFQQMAVEIGKAMNAHREIAKAGQ